MNGNVVAVFTVLFVAGTVGGIAASLAAVEGQFEAGYEKGYTEGYSTSEANHAMAAVEMKKAGICGYAAMAWDRYQCASTPLYVGE